jgi:hypothetical protein
VSDFRLSQRSLFALEAANFPSIEGDDDYGRMWTNFQGKDEEVSGVVDQLDATTAHLEQINRLTRTTQPNTTHTTAQHNNATATATATTGGGGRSGGGGGSSQGSG